MQDVNNYIDSPKKILIPTHMKKKGKKTIKK